MANHTYDYPRPAVTADVAVVSVEERPRVLLILRKQDPFADCWALPGGFVNAGERLIDAAMRELKEETGIEAFALEQLHSFGDPGRDPRGWTITIAYLARVHRDQVKPVAADDAASVEWFPLDELPKLAFDHAAILQRVKTRLADRSL